MQRKLVDKDIWVSDGEEIITMYEAHKRYGDGKFPTSICGNCFTFEEYNKLPLIAPPGYIDKGILPLKSKMLLFSEPKVGKSFLAMQIAYCIAESEEWLGFATTNQEIRTLYIQAEIAEIELLVRLAHLPSNYAYAETIHAAKLLGKQVDILINRIETIHPSVVILDPLYMFIDGDLTEIADITKCNSIIDNIIDKYNCSMVIVHHSRKPREESTQGIMEALGSIAITAFYDSILWFEKINSQASLLHFLLRNAKSPQPILVSQNAHGLWQLIDISKLLSYLPNSISDITRLSGYSQEVVKACLDDGVAAGKLKRDTWGKYTKEIK